MVSIEKFEMSSFKGKMTPRKKAHYCNLKAKNKGTQRAAFKRGEDSFTSRFGREGHSSHWD